MTHRPSIKRSTSLNFASSIAPIIVALATTPIFLDMVGAERYGVLAIVWIFQGYFGFLDLGLSAASSNRIAQLDDATPAQRESVLWTAILVNGALGVTGGVILYCLIDFVLAFIHINPVLHDELKPALPYLAAIVPLSNLIGVLNGALIGRERFGILNAVQLPVTLMYQLTPLAAAFLFNPTLEYLVYGVFAAGSTALVLNAAVVWWVFPMCFASGPRLQTARSLFSYGLWISVTSIVQSLLETVDRLLVGHMLGPSAVTWYQIPFNLAERLRLVPRAVTRTLFPRLSALETATANELTVNTIRILCALITPMAVFGMFLMHPVLVLWVGDQLATQGAGVGETILVGIWVNSLASIVVCHLQATGRPGIVARFQTIEILPFIAMLWWGMTTLGVLGAALAWSARSILDALLLLHAARLDLNGAALVRRLVAPALVVCTAWIATLLFDPLSWFAVIAWAIIAVVALIHCAVELAPHLSSVGSRDRRLQVSE
jgi:O-antigen/teichoic acid export membrane protein